eukprot:1465729-Pleurochrysis_carterae.AAC.1
MNNHFACFPAHRKTFTSGFATSHIIIADKVMTILNLFDLFQSVYSPVNFNDKVDAGTIEMSILTFN